MLLTGDRDLIEFKAHAQGKVVITPPNLVFTDRLLFPDEGIELFHSPGHTSDSSSCYDSVDRVLIAGDNVESPTPYLNDDAFDTYISTLEFYKGLQWDSLVTGHDPLILDKSLILSNLQYINDFKNLKIDSSALTTGELSHHYTNLTTVGRYVLAGGRKSEAEKYYKEAFHILESMGDNPSARGQLDALRRELS
jgi:glyoxylase-like metal-dependent hydrolase (beta-lactamase superfamily II)